MSSNLSAQERGPEIASRERWAGYSRPQLSIMAGMLQPLLLSGGNVEADLHYRRLVIGYSHGFNLKLPPVGDVKSQNLSLKLPFSTGLGVGVRLLEWLDVRVEAKVHRFGVVQAQDNSPSFSYTTVTLGAGIYARYRPFYHFGIAARTPTWAHGFVIAPSVRVWPDVWTSEPDDTIDYDNTTTGEREAHQLQSAGIANTPLLTNVGLGYMITF